MTRKEKFFILKSLGLFYGMVKEPPKVEAIKLILAEMADEELILKVENGFIYFQLFPDEFINPNSFGIAYELGKRKLLPTGKKIDLRYFGDNVNERDKNFYLNSFIGKYKDFSITAINHVFGGNRAGDAPLSYEMHHYITLYDVM